MHVYDCGDNVRVYTEIRAGNRGDWNHNSEGAIVHWPIKNYTPRFTNIRVVISTPTLPCRSSVRRHAIFLWGLSLAS